MKMTKFKQLCSAFQAAQDEFQKFQQDCQQLGIEFVKTMKEYFEVPDSQVSLFRINGKNEFILVQPSVMHALTLRPDSLWQFGIGLTVCAAPDTLPQEQILIHILIRKDIDGFLYLRYADQKPEFKIEKADDYNFIPFLDFLHGTIMDIYADQLVQFIGEDTRRKIGYNLKEE